MGKRDTRIKAYTYKYKSKSGDEYVVQMKVYYWTPDYSRVPEEKVRIDFLCVPEDRKKKDKSLFFTVTYLNDSSWDTLYHHGFLDFNEQIREYAITEETVLLYCYGEKSPKPFHLFDNFDIVSHAIMYRSEDDFYKFVQVERGKFKLR